MVTPKIKQQRIKQQRMLEKLLLRPDIWLGESMHKSSRYFANNRSLTTGHTELDKCLIAGGWPIGGLIEITQDGLGKGEWQLLAPTLRHLKQTPGYIVLIHPPVLPYAPGLSALGIKLSETLIVEPKNRNQAISAFTEALGHSACKVLLFWENKIRLKPQELRKLQLAASGSRALCLLFRHPNSLKQSSTAVLRLHIQINDQKIQVQILKQRGDFQQKTLHLDLPTTWEAMPALSSRKWLMPQSSTLTKAKIFPFPQQKVSTLRRP